MKIAALKLIQLTCILSAMIFLVSCQTPVRVPQATQTGGIATQTEIPNSTAFTSTITSTSLPAATQTPKSVTSSTITPMAAIPVQAGPLTLDVTNAGTQMQRLARLGYGHAEAVAFSPDGKYLAVGTGAGIVLYEAKTFEQVRLIETNKPVTHMAFSPDGSLLAVAIDYHEISLWEVESGQMIMEIAASLESGISSLLYAKGGFIAASGGDPWGVMWFEVWSTSTGKIVFGKSINNASFLSLDITLNGETLYYGTDAEGGILIDLASKIIVDHIIAEPIVRFSPVGNSLFMADSENSLASIWDIRTKQSTYLPELTGCEIISRNGKYMICNNSNDDSILIFDPNTGSILKKIAPAAAFSATISVDGRYVAYYGNDAVKIFDTNMDKIVKTLRFETTTSLAVGIGLNTGAEQYLAATGTSNGNISIWDLSSGETINTMTTNERTIRALVFSPDRRTLASLDNGGQIRLWDLREMKQTALYEIGSSGFYRWKISFDLQGQKLILAGDQSGLLLDIQSGKFTNLYVAFYAVRDSTGDIFQITHYFENVYDERRISIKQIDQSGQVEFSIPPATEVSLLDSLAISPDARFLAVGFGSSPIYILDLKSGKLFNSLHGHAPGMCRGDCGYVETYESIKFSPQNNLLLSVGQDGTTRLWNIPGTAQLRQLDTCCLAAFSPDGRLLVTAGDEFSNAPIQVWGVPPLP